MAGNSLAGLFDISGPVTTAFGPRYLSTHVNRDAGIGGGNSQPHKIIKASGSLFNRTLVLTNQIVAGVSTVKDPAPAVNTNLSAGRPPGGSSSHLISKTYEEQN